MNYSERAIVNMLKAGVISHPVLLWYISAIERGEHLHASGQLAEAAAKVVAVDKILAPPKANRKAAKRTTHE